MRPAALILALAALAFSPEAASAATAYLDLDYDIDSAPAPSPASENQLDVYVPDGTAAAGRPVVVYAHGGAWAIGDKRNAIMSKVELFTGAGYVFVSINYRLSPSTIPPGGPDPDRVKFPDHPHDVGEAVAWIARHIAAYGGDPDRIALIGHSAGAHLVSLVSTDPRYVTAYGVRPWQLIGTVSLDTEAYDVPRRLVAAGPSAEAIFHNAFGTPAENAASGAWSEGSPIRWAGSDDPPFMLVTQAEVPDRVQQTESMAAALAQGGGTEIFYAPYDHEGINNAVGSTADGAGETGRIMTFLARAVEAGKEPRAKLSRHPKRRIRTASAKARVRFAIEPNLAGTVRCRLGKGKLKRCGLRRNFRVGPGGHIFRFQVTSARGRPGPVQRFRFAVRRKG
jgi:arylformamidase